MTVTSRLTTEERQFLASLNILNENFYTRKDVVKIAKELLGKIIVTCFDEQLTAARITETEAYNGIIDKASHAYNNRRTKRTEIMYANGGAAYVYLCYGIHHLFNVVTSLKDVPHAVLIRAAEPLIGIDTMLTRTHKKKLDYTLTSGPGNVSKALGIYTHHTGIDLRSDHFFIAEDDYVLSNKNIITATRIGVNYAAEDALLPYRFLIKDNKYVTKLPKLIG
ncbi:DNA-3-methyladenine glycosylase [Parafilimonas sp.]|uniref:DNA-3-methyladenine glycosylase n=1 Tax=Parafilimonas sp. TaxID=1969739 RepID=UPI0039E32FD4